MLTFKSKYTVPVFRLLFSSIPVASSASSTASACARSQVISMAVGSPTESSAHGKAARGQNRGSRQRFRTRLVFIPRIPEFRSSTFCFFKRFERSEAIEHLERLERDSFPRGCVFASRSSVSGAGEGLPYAPWRILQSLGLLPGLPFPKRRRRAAVGRARSHRRMC